MKLTDEITSVDTTWNRKKFDDELWNICHKHRKPHSPEHRGKKIVLWSEGDNYVFDFNKRNENGKLTAIYKWTVDWKFGDKMVNLWRRHWWN